MKKFLFILLFSFIICSSFSQSMVWAKQLGGLKNESVWSLAIDASSNVYSVGTFDSIADFDPGPATFTMSPFGGNDIFISKLDAAGNFVWVKQIGGIAIRGITIDVTGNILVTGWFGSLEDFDPGLSTFTMSPSGNTDLFIVKLDASGNFVWAKQIGGPGVGVTSYAITSDQNGNVLTTGNFNGGTSDFDPGPGTYTMNFSSGTIFISKLDAFGNFIWAKNFSDGRGYSIKTDASGSVYTSGYYNGPNLDFDPNVGISNLGFFGTFDIFISKLDVSGNFVWAKQLGGTQWDESFGIEVDALGNVYTTGDFQGTADFNPGAGVYNLTSAGNWDIYVNKLDPLGNFLWAKSFPSTAWDEGHGISLDASNNVYTSGFNFAVADFDPGVGTYTLSPGAYVSKLNSSGNFVWAKSFSSSSGWGIVVDPSFNIYTTGVFSGTADFEPDAGVYNISSFSSKNDVFVHKMNVCTAPSSPTNITAAANLTVCNGGTTSLTVSGSGLINWYGSPSSTISIGSGSVFVTPTLTSNTVFYAEAVTCSPSFTRTSILVSVNPLPNVIASSPTFAVCSGTMSCLISSGALTYSWTGPCGFSSTQQNPCFPFNSTCTCSYSVTGTDVNGCKNAASVCITVIPNPTVTANTSNSLICVGQTATLTAGGANTYSWSTSSTGSATVISPTVTTNYSVTGTDVNGCTNVASITQSVSACVGVDEFTNNSEIKIFPNPTNGQFTLLFNKAKEKAEVKVVNAIGQIVLRKTILSTDKINLNISDRAGGVYFVEVSVDGESYRTKIVKE